MGELIKKTSFKAPIKKVWGIWADVEKTPEWVKGVRSSEVTSAVREGKGLNWLEKCDVDGQNIQMDHEVVEWEEHSRVLVRSSLPMNGLMEREIKFFQADGHTELEARITWDFGIITLFVGEDKLHQVMEKSFEATLENWRRLAENP